MTTPVSTLADLAAATHGNWLYPPEDPTRPITGFSFDTRTLQPGNVFLALKTPKADGHNYLPQAFAAGASAALVEQPVDTDRPTLKVPSVLNALQTAARHHRDALTRPVIAVIGSNGKTTTRQLIHTAISSTLTGTQSPKSFNNHLGAPLTLLHARPDHDFLVIELGTNHPGELEPLAQLARPTHIVLTTLGSEHLEFFHDLAGVTAEETSALHHLQPPATVIASAQAWSVVQQHAPHIAREHTPILYSDTDTAAPIYIKPDSLTQSAAITTFTASVHGQNLNIALPLPGQHNAANTLAALAVAHELDIPLPSAATALTQLPTVARRFERVQLHNLLLIDDAYNANPESTALAIDTFLQLDHPGPKRLILGDMRELGAHTDHAHTTILRQLEHAPIQDLTLIGPHYTNAASRYTLPFPVKTHPALTDQTIEQILANLQPGDTILLKASLGMNFIQLRNAIENQDRQPIP